MESIVRVYYIEGWVRVRCVEQRRPPSPSVAGLFGPRRPSVPAKFVVPFPGWLFPILWVWVMITVVAFATIGVGEITCGHVIRLVDPLQKHIATADALEQPRVATVEPTALHKCTDELKSIMNQLLTSQAIHLEPHNYISDTKNPRDKELISGP